MPSDVYLSINMGPEALVSPRFDEALRGVRTDRVVVEITEHAPTTDYPRLKQELRYLRGLGVRIAVDDAGAGFASFRHILELRPDIIKLDTSITRDVHAEVPKQALVSALVAFASKLGAELVAEGVETAEEAVELGALGVQFVQGFHIARPGPIPDRFTIPELEMPSNPPARR
jgi:EAL domain-containing protein (putative c-di-GMP-specific phosphodiesterase class I)